MSNTFGFKLGIEGEREFKSKLSEINQNMKVLGSELKVVSSEFDGQEKSVRSLSSRNEVLKKTVDEQKDKVRLLTEALQNASDSFGENDRRTKEWQIKLNNATAELNKMERELDQSQRELAELEKAEKEAAEAADKLGKEVDETGDKAKKSGRKLVNMKDDAKELQASMDKVASGIKAAALAIGAAIAAAGTALTAMTVDAAAYADEIITASTVTGMSRKSLQAYSYAADLVDVSLNTLTGSMRKNITAMKGARDGSEKYVSAYKQLGVQVTDTNGNLRDSETVYWEAIDALGKMTDETERDALAMDIFGKSAQDLNPLIAQGSKGIAELTDEAKRMGAVLSDETISELGAFDDSVQRLKQGFKSAKNQLGTVLLPELQKAAQWGIDKLKDFTNALKDPQSETRKLVDDLKEFSVTAGKILFNALKVLADVLLFFARNIKVIVPVLGTLTTAFLVLRAACSVHTAITAVQTALAALPPTASSAKVAMTGLSAAMSTNVIGAVAMAASAIAMLTVAIVGLCTANDDVVDETPEFVKAAGDRAKAAAEEKEAADKAAKSYWDLISTQTESAKSTSAELEHTKKLADELLSLADKKGKVKKADRERAEFILGELNTALETEYKITDGQIENYKDLKDSIYDAIEAKKAQILLDAYEPVYREALQKRVELEKEQADIEKKITEQERKAADARQKFLEAYESGAEDTYDLCNAYNAEQMALNTLRDTYTENEAVLTDYYGTITDFEAASTQMLKGNTDKAIDILNDRTTAFVSASDVMTKTTDEQKKIMLEQYETLTTRAEQMEKRLKNGVKGVTQEMVDDAKAMAEKAGDEYDAVGGVIPERMADGVNITKGKFTEATKATVREGIAAGRKEADPSLIGVFLVDGMAEGLKSRTSSFRNAMRDVIRAGITAAKVEAQIKSPSRRMRDEVGQQIGKGAELGIIDATADIKSAVVSQMREVHEAYSRSSKFKLDMSGVLGDVNADLRKLSSVMSPIAFDRQSNVFNLYPRELTQAQVDYLVTKVNLALGSKLG